MDGMNSAKAGNARKIIAEASKYPVSNLGFPESYARYATHIPKFSPARQTTLLAK
jgi:hypothetical protein